MTKEEIIELSLSKYQSLYDWLEKHPLPLWELGHKGKWSTGQHIIHLHQSLLPLNRALGLPKIVLKWKFERPNRSLRTYDEVKNRYLERLSMAAPDLLSPYSKQMPRATVESKQVWIKQLRLEATKLTRNIHKWKETDLDKILLPHPLMGKMPVREILMWSAYHVEHHLLTLQAKYAKLDFD